jgi:hypothetical protein
MGETEALAWGVLRMATIEGAQAVGLGDKAGSLKAEKQTAPGPVRMSLRTPMNARMFEIDGVPTLRCLARTPEQCYTCRKTCERGGAVNRSPDSQQETATTRAGSNGGTRTPRDPLSNTPPGTTSAGIPRSLAPFFQEYDLDQLDPTEHSSLIVERTLAYGDRRELRWLFDRYGKGALREWVQDVGARRLPWRRYNLWCVLMGLPPAQRAERRGVWPY